MERPALGRGGLPGAVPAAVGKTAPRASRNHAHGRADGLTGMPGGPQGSTVCANPAESTRM